MKLKFHSEGFLVSRKTKKEIKKKLMAKVGVSISIFKKIPINNSCAIYSECNGEYNPLAIFGDISNQETNYFFGTIGLTRPKRIFFFLMDIDSLLWVAGENVIMPTSKDEKKVYVKIN
jgi:hypothetical protein